MTDKPDFVLQTYIRCTPEALWDALSDPGQMAAYHFASDRVERDGDRLVIYGPDGARMLICRELVVDRAAGRVVTTFEPLWEADAIVSEVTYLVRQEGDHCALTVEHRGLKYGPDGVADGWARTIAGLKSWLETGRAISFPDPAMAAVQA